MNNKLPKLRSGFVLGDYIIGIANKSDVPYLVIERRAYHKKRRGMPFEKLLAMLPRGWR